MPIGLPAALLASSLIGGGASIAGSALAGRPKTSTATSGPTWTPDQQRLIDQLLSFSGDTVSDPTAGLRPIQAAGEEQINASYGNIPRIISEQMARRGYGSSGSFGNTMYQTQLGRLSSLSQLRGQMAGLASDRQMQAAGLGDRLLSTVSGRTQTGTSPDYSGGNALMSTGNAFNNIGMLLMMQKMLQQPGAEGVMG